MSYRIKSKKRTVLLALALLTALAVVPAAGYTVAKSQVKTLQIPLLTPAVDHMPSTGTAWTYNFSDYRDGALPSTDWNIETGSKMNHNGELQTYTSSQDNVCIENGVLVIEAKPQNKDGEPYTSARVNTKGKFDFQYGTFEACGYRHMAGCLANARAERI